MERQYPNVEKLNADKVIAIFSFVQTLLFLIVYTLMVIVVKRRLHPIKLERVANVTIASFIFCQTLMLAVQAVYLTIHLKNSGDKPDDEIEKILKICQLITINLNYFVLLFYTYQMRIVYIKLSSQGSDEFFGRIKSTNFIWTILIIEQIVSISIGILEIYYNKEKVIKIIQIPFNVLTEGYLLYLQFFYFSYILRKKSAVNAISQKQWSCKSKTLISWFFIVLVINTLNFIFINTLNIIVISINSVNLQKQEKFLKESEHFALYWYDTLNLSNGICFLIVFNQMARSSQKRKNLRVEKYDVSKSEAAISKRLIDDHNNLGTQRETEFVQNILKYTEYPNRVSINPDIAPQLIKPQEESAEYVYRQTDSNDQDSSINSTQEQMLFFQQQASTMYQEINQRQGKFNSFRNLNQSLIFKNPSMQTKKPSFGIKSDGNDINIQISQTPSDKRKDKSQQQSKKKSLLNNQIFQDFILSNLDQDLNKQWIKSYNETSSSSSSNSNTRSNRSKGVKNSSNLKLPNNQFRNTGNFKNKQEQLFLEEDK